MKIETEKPNVMLIKYRQELGDADYGTCLWADFYFDLDGYSLCIQSDRGNAAYTWVQTPSETFLHLMARISGDYLLYKLFRDKVRFNSDEKRIVRVFEDYVQPKITKILRGQGNNA